MTVLDVVSPRETRPTIRLPLVVGARRGWFSVLDPASGLDRPLTGVTDWDPARPPGRDHLVLVTTPRPNGEELVAALAAACQADAAAVVVREAELGIPASPGVPVIAVDERIGWDEIRTLVRSLLSGTRFGARGTNPTAGGLYDLAESAALALDGAVVVTDAAFRVLAFGCRGAVDGLTSETILARRVPAAVRERLVRVRSVACLDAPGAGSRWAAPVEVGKVVGGYVLFSPGPDTPDSVSRMLNDVATAAAAWFIDEPTGRADEDAIRAELLRGLLTGTGSLEALTERLGTSRRWCLVGLGSHADAPAVTSDVEGGLARCARMLDPGAATAIVGDLVYVLFPSTPGSGPADFAERLRGRASASAGVPLAACVGPPCVTGDEVRAELGALRHAVSMLVRRPVPATAELAELRPHVLIAELARLAGEHPGLLTGALDVLRRDASRRGVDYLDTLRSWFDAGGDATRAAAALQVHRNTFRYRLQRIETLCAVDLDDPVQRFTLELQTRLLALRDGW
ncbi:CdaR family transcriptional regulator [Amycolatopsis sp. EV170708-02-1]|uniref:PucR family transcriptional regulator n=1 Tax=Amycolatopsis sp. EV170708-02-1 TaxID=2919322 RepID=UPI001F0B9749|nr:PucR family transcriptional regulator [Amycolatopsis sp. EV170708-02-1]UMP07263.1 helix-turn-helix domain-containing protein [Amycolatopsis sp. EV170708-02-1]